MRAVLVVLLSTLVVCAPAFLTSACSFLSFSSSFQLCAGHQWLSGCVRYSLCCTQPGHGLRSRKADICLLCSPFLFLFSACWGSNACVLIVESLSCLQPPSTNSHMPPFPEFPLALVMQLRSAGPRTQERHR